MRGLKFGSTSTIPMFGISGGATRGPREPRRNRALRAGILAGTFDGRIDGGADESGIGGTRAPSGAGTPGGSARGGFSRGGAAPRLHGEGPSAFFVGAIKSPTCAP